MAFKFPKEARDYFKNIMAEGGGGGTERFDMFDIYYYCFLIGASLNKIDAEGDTLGTEFQKGYPDKYRNTKEYITGLLISAELKRNKTKSDDTSYQQVMMEIIDTNEASQLSATGFRRMNEYAFKGFQEIKERCQFPPNSRESFLISFHNLINQIA